MPDYEPKDLTGALFRNQKKEKPSQPDYTGSACWVGEGSEANVFLRVDGSDPGGCNSAALPMRGWCVRCVGPFFIVCVRPRAPEVGDVAGQNEGAHNSGNRQ